jgi:hypothetical protein
MNGCKKLTNNSYGEFYWFLQVVRAGCLNRDARQLYANNFIPFGQMQRTYRICIFI